MDGDATWWRADKLLTMSNDDVHTINHTPVGPTTARGRVFQIPTVYSSTILLLYSTPILCIFERPDIPTGDSSLQRHPY
jgi:hypothetical protein